MRFSFQYLSLRAWVEVRSDGAAALCAASNLNSRTDDKGLYFGKDLLTNSEVMLDLNTLASKQLVMCGSRKNFYFPASLDAVSRYV